MSASAHQIRPQAGPQERFLSSSADIAIYGGAAGSGKTAALLIEPLRHVRNGRFRCVMFRRTYPEISNPGGMWDESQSIYRRLGAEPKQTTLEWLFPEDPRGERAVIKMAHLQHEDDKRAWDGAQIPLICFDQVESFTDTQVWYLLSRNRDAHRTTAKPYIRMTCNPVPKDDPTGGWLRELLAWWIDDESGFPVLERSGVLRWFVRDGEELIWDDGPDALAARYPGSMPLSLTFVPGKVTDNRVLMEADPGYMARLLALSRVERERLLDGNWNVRPSAGKVFDQAWFEVVDAAPRTLRRVRFWDKAATEERGRDTGGRRGDPDFSAGVLVGWDETTDLYYVEDVVHGRWSAEHRNRVMRQTAELDGPDVAIRLEQEPGSGGKESAEISVRQLAGYNVRAEPSTGDKLSYMYPLSAQAERGRVKVVRAPWNKKFLAELHAIPEGKHDDMADAASKGFCKLTLAVGASVRVSTVGEGDDTLGHKRVTLVG